jgi:molybdenum cofactor cytidylyltransferase
MERLEAIVLAGGSGSRFGGGKLLAAHLGGVLIDGALRAALAAPVARVIVVTGHDGDRVAAAAAHLATRDHAEPTLQIVHAERHAEGMAETLKAGVAALSRDVEGAIVFLGDMPRIPLHLPAKLVKTIGNRSAAAPVYRGRRGHPVLFAARLFPNLLTLSGNRGAGLLLESLGDDLALVEVDDAGVRFDVDLRADLVL